MNRAGGNIVPTKDSSPIGLAILCRVLAELFIVGSYDRIAYAATGVDFGWRALERRM